MASVAGPSRWPSVRADAQPRGLLEIELDAGVALPAGGRQFDFPEGFARAAPVVEAGLRWNLGKNGSLAAALQHVQFGYIDGARPHQENLLPRLAPHDERPDLERGDDEKHRTRPLSPFSCS